MSEEMTLWCPDCAEVGMGIYLWKRPGPNRGKVVARFPHGTVVLMAKSAFSIEEGRNYYQVRVRGKEGWVPETLVKAGMMG